MRDIGVPAKPLKTDADIDKLTADVSNARFLWPFSTFSIDVTKVSMDRINKFLEIRNGLSDISIFHSPENVEEEDLSAPMIRQIYDGHQVGPKIGRILAAGNLSALRLKFFGDVTLMGEAETAHFPSKLNNLKTLEVVYAKPNDALEGDLAELLSSRAEYLRKVCIRAREHSSYSPNLIPRIPGLLYRRYLRDPPTLRLSADVRVQDFETFQTLYQAGYNRVEVLNLGFPNYHYEQRHAPIGFGALLCSLTQLMSLHSQSLEDLLLVSPLVEEIQETGSNVQIQLPVMPKLKRLVLSFPQKGATVVSPIAPFVEGQLPKLANVDLGFDHGWFKDSIFPNVNLLQVNYQDPMSTYHQIFPGLTRLLYYGQDATTFVGDILKRECGGVEVLGCFGFTNRITSSQHKNYLTQFSKTILADSYRDMRVADEHLLGHLYGMVKLN